MSWLEQKPTYQEQLLLIPFWIQFWKLPKLTTLKDALTETLKWSNSSRNLPEHKQSSTQKHHTVYPKLVLPSFSSCTGAHFLWVIRRGELTVQRIFALCCCCFVYGQREGMPELNTWNSGRPKKYVVQKMAQTAECVREREREWRREKERVQENWGGRDEWVNGWLNRRKEKPCNIFGIHFLLSTGTLDWQLNALYLSYFLTGRNVK